MPATRQTSDVSRNKFNAADMPEIRHVRSALLKSLKLIKKTKRLDRITKAILPDIDWKKLSVNIPTIDQSIQTSIDDLNNSILNFRSSMAEQLEQIMCSISTTVEQQARTSASTPVIFTAAATMAQKYHARENKPSTRPLRQHKPSMPAPTPSTSTSKHTKSPRPPKTSTRSAQGPRLTSSPDTNLQTSLRPLPTKPTKPPPKSAPTPSTTSRRTRSNKKCKYFRSLSPSTQQAIEEEALRNSQRSAEEIEAHGRAYIEKFNQQQRKDGYSPEEYLHFTEQLQFSSPFNPGLD